MTHRKPIATDKNYLWLIDGDQQIIPAVGVKKVSIRGGGFEIWTCGQCGYEWHGHVPCPNCGTPCSARLRPGHVILSALWGDQAEVLDRPDGFTLEILHGECGRIDDRTMQDVIMRFTDCKVTRRWIDEPAPGFAYPDCPEILLVNLAICCQVAFFWAERIGEVT